MQLHHGQLALLHLSSFFVGHWLVLAHNITPSEEIGYKLNGLLKAGFLFPQSCAIDQSHEDQTALTLEMVVIFESSGCIILPVLFYRYPGGRFWSTIINRRPCRFVYLICLPDLVLLHGYQHSEWKWCERVFLDTGISQHTNSVLACTGHSSQTISCATPGMWNKGNAFINRSSLLW
jgi:hypothetical protein